MQSTPIHTYGYYLLCAGLLVLMYPPGFGQNTPINGGDRQLDQQQERAYSTAQYQVTIFGQHGRTLKRLFVGFGLNNTVHKGELTRDYKRLGSRFFELGGELSTALDPTGWYRLNYGLGVQFNGLKPKGNRIFQENGRETELVTFPERLEKAKLRLDHLVVPIHVEFGPADADFQAQGWRVGLGGYTGIRMGTRQKLHYRMDGRRQREGQAQRLHANDVVYGWSAYAGYGKTALYLKYDLNPLFQHDAEKQHNVSLGLRLTFY